MEVKTNKTSFLYKNSNGHHNTELGKISSYNWTTQKTKKRRNTGKNPPKNGGCNGISSFQLLIILADIFLG
jgi:hypothetical protein